MLDPFYHVYNMIYTIHCGLAIKPFNQSETTITEKWVAEEDKAIIMQRVFE